MPRKTALPLQKLGLGQVGKASKKRSDATEVRLTR